MEITVNPHAIWLLVSVCALSSVPQAPALVFGTYDSARHDRFASGFPGTSATATSSAVFLAAGYDLSGIGWSLGDERDTATMISPRHFVTARHSNVGTTIRFLGNDGITRDYTVGSYEAALNSAEDPTDLFIGTLTTDIDTAQITFYPVADRPNESDYFGEALLLQGLHSRFGTGTIVAAPGESDDPFLDFDVPASGGFLINETRGFQFKVDTTDISRSPDDVYFEIGDSSDPTFIIDGGQLVLVGVHSAVDTTLPTKRSFDTFVPHYLDQIDGFMADEGYTATRVGGVDVPLLLSIADSQDPAEGGVSFSYTLTVENTGNASETGIEIQFVLPAGSTFIGVSGAGWSASASAGTVTITRGSIGAMSASAVTVSVTPATENSAALVASGTVSSDTGPGNAGASETTQIYTPFSIYASGLTDQTPGGDNDNDGIANLTEYLLGLPSDQFSAPPVLAPAINGTLSFTRRRRTPVSAGFYVSTNLEAWDPLPGTVTTSTVDYNFETVTLTPTLPFKTGPRRFLRLQVSE